MMQKPYCDKWLYERPEYRDAFAQVIALWEELEKKGLFATLRLEKMRVLPDGEEPMALAVLMAFQDCHEPLPDRLRNKVTRYLDFRVPVNKTKFRIRDGFQMAAGWIRAGLVRPGRRLEAPEEGNRGQRRCAMGN